MRRIVALAAAIVLGLAGCTGSANTDATASPSSSTSTTIEQTKSAQATPTATPRNMTFVSPKSIMTSDGNAVFLEVDEPFACVREIAITVKGFTPNGITTVEIKSTDGSYKTSEKVTNGGDGRAFTSLLCTGYKSGGYTLTMSDESSKKWAQVPFTSIA